MKKRLINIITALAVMTASVLLAVSCSQETVTGTAEFSKVLIKPVITDSKNLTSVTPMHPTRYTYTASQNFLSQGAASDLGATSVEKDLEAEGSGDVFSTEDKFAQGEWTFVVRGYKEVSANEAEDILVYEGSVTVYLTQSVHTVVVPMSAQFSSNPSVVGSVTVTTTSIRLASGNNLGNFEVKVFNLEGVEQTSYAQTIPATVVSANSTNNVTGSATFNLPEGQYILTVRYVCGADSLGPAQVAVKVKNGIPATVTGDVESGAFTSPSVSMTYLGGTLAKSGSEDANGDYTFTFTPSGVTEGLTYRWYVNGANLTPANTNSGTFKYGNGIGAGVYYVTCVVSTGTGTSGDIYSATQVLYLNR